MATNDVTATLIDILARRVPREVLSAHPPDETRLESLGVSSAEMINVVIDIEDRFEIEVDETRLYQFRTIRDLVAAIEATRRERAG